MSIEVQKLINFKKIFHEKFSFGVTLVHLSAVLQMVYKERSVVEGSLVSLFVENKVMANELCSSCWKDSCAICVQFENILFLSWHGVTRRACVNDKRGSLVE